METKWLVGGVAALAGFGALAFYLSDDGEGPVEHTEAVPLTREKLVEVLKDLKRETASAFITLASFAMSVKEQVQGKIGDADLKEILSTQSPINEQLKRSEKKIYEKHGVTEEQMKTTYENSYQDDPEIKKLITDMQEAQENAFKGQAPTSDGKIPEFLTPDKVIEILKEMYDVSAKVAFVKIEKLRSDGIPLSPYDARFIKETESLERDTDAAKQAIYQKHGLGNYDEPASMIMHSAIQKYAQNMRFVAQMTRVEEDYRHMMQGIMMGQSTEKDVQRIMEADEDQAEQDHDEEEEADRLIEALEFRQMGSIEMDIEEEVEFEKNKSPAKVIDITDQDEDKKLPADTKPQELPKQEDHKSEEDNKAQELPKQDDHKSEESHKPQEASKPEEAHKPEEKPKQEDTTAPSDTSAIKH